MKCDSVTPDLFIGRAPTEPEGFEQLRAMKITAILSLQTAEDVGPGQLYRRRNAATKAGLSFHNVPVTDFDRADLQLKLPDCVAELDRLVKGGETVFLHCTAGVSRSPTVAAAFLHWKLGWGLDQALAHVQSVRACCPDGETIRNCEGPQDVGK